MSKLNIKALAAAYNSARSIGFTLADICALVNWKYAESLADESGNEILKIVVKLLKFLCSLTPESRDELEIVLDEETRKIIA